MIRLGQDQVLALVAEHGTFEPGERVSAHVDRAARHATECNHTATHLLHAALRRRLGSHVHQAGSYVGPDKLRFDFTHASALSPEELRQVEDDVNRWILESHPVRALTTTLDEAKRLGAMALFNEKYGEVVRMVEVGDGSFSRELCGGTHVAQHRRAGAVPDPVRDLERGQRAPDRGDHRSGGGELHAHPRPPAGAAPPRRCACPANGCRTRSRELSAPRARARARGARARRAATARSTSTSWPPGAVATDGASVLVAAVTAPDAQALLQLVDRLKGKLGDAAIVLGSAGEGRVDLVASVAPSLVKRGVRAGEIVKVAAARGRRRWRRARHARPGRRPRP